MEEDPPLRIAGGGSRIIIHNNTAGEIHCLNGSHLLVSLPYDSYILLSSFEYQDSSQSEKTNSRKMKIPKVNNMYVQSRMCV
jgi:hypothetical protein